MRLNYKTLCIGLVIAGLLSSSAFGQHENMLYQAFAWTVGARDSRTVASQNVFSSSELKEFMISVLSHSGDPAVREFVRDNPLEEIAIGSYAVRDLNGDGNLQLIVTYDLVGRSQFSTFAIIGRHTGGFVVAVANSNRSLADINDAIIDIGGDGRSRVLTFDRCPAFPSPVQLLTEAAQDIEDFPCYSTSINEWNGQELVDVSARFPEYFEKQILPEAEAGIQAIERTGDSRAAVAASFYQVVKFRAARLAGNPRAGIPEAMTWAASPERELQLNAIRTLQGVADVDARALKTIQKLAQAKDTEIREAAISAIFQLRRRH
jgi:hypothetical protein